MKKFNSEFLEKLKPLLDEGVELKRESNYRGNLKTVMLYTNNMQSYKFRFILNGKTKMIILESNWNHFKKKVLNYLEETE
ncbi:MAG: hypothetical protein ACRCZO_19115 [Cetobacterium sp.]